MYKDNYSSDNIPRDRRIIRRDPWNDCRRISIKMDAPWLEIDFSRVVFTIGKTSTRAKRWIGIEDKRTGRGKKEKIPRRLAQRSLQSHVFIDHIHCTCTCVDASTERRWNGDKTGWKSREFFKHFFFFFFKANSHALQIAWNLVFFLMDSIRYRF